MQDSDNTSTLKDTIIVANPGTGKTWEIVNRVMQLLKSGVSGEDIVCVTFTNKAADEMKTRVIREARKSPEIFDQAMRIEVSTIHSYATSYLQESGINAEITTNTVLRYIVYQKLLELKTFDYNQGYLIEQIVPKIENGIRYLKSFGIVPEKIDRDAVSKLVREEIAGTNSANMTPRAIDILVRDFVAIFEEYEAFKLKEGLMDFNDLLRIFLAEMKDRHRKFVLVDEFQDLNRMQVEIVGRLAETKFFVGDRKQSIFGFQGGSLSSFNSYLKDSQFHIVGKNINHRSTNNILNFASSYFLANSKDEYSRKEIAGLKNPSKGNGKKVTIVPSSNPTADAVSELRAMMASGQQEPRDIAIIARTNTQITKIAENLDAVGIPYSSTIRNKVNQSQIDGILDYVSGLVSEDPAVISRALMTPFSGLTLKEAVEIQGKLRENGLDPELLPENFRELRELKFGLTLVEQAFDRVILPIASSLGPGYVNSANLTLESAREYLSVFSSYSLDGYLNFMTLSSEQSESDLKKSRVNLLTVHKAKGLEFDTVIYVPAEFPNRLVYFDILTSAIIRTSTGVDVEQDLREEPLRIDFVALTRPEEKLVIVAENKLLPRFELDNDYYEESSIDTELEVSKTGKYDEAYMMFVNGRFDEAKKILSERDRWLLKAIRDYFSGLTRLSYSILESVSDPYRFLKDYILNIKESSPFTERGTNFHDIAHRYATGALSKERIPEAVAQDFTNLEHALGILKADYAVPPTYSELAIELPLSEVFTEVGVPDNIVMKGKIDAVFTGTGEKGTHLIADYKTSRKVDAKHWHQLWLYTRMYRRKYGIPPENISGGVIYVGLRETINTGERGYDVQIRDYYKIKTDVVERRLKEILHYMDQPEAFAENLLSRPVRSELDSRLREILERSL